MLKLYTLFVSAILFLNVSILDEVRTNYNKLAADKALCKKMILALEETKDNSATQLAYLGGLQTIWANHTLNPLSKLSTFKKGKKI